MDVIYLVYNIYATNMHVKFNKVVVAGVAFNGGIAL